MKDWRASSEQMKRRSKNGLRSTYYFPLADRLFASVRSAPKSFQSKLYAKLQVDEAALGGTYERLWYAFGRLKGKAA